MESLKNSVNKQNNDYFIHLIRIAKADDNLSNNELESLNRIGKKIGFSDTEITGLIETTGKSDYIPPVELAERFGQVFEIVKMTLADGVIDKNEMRLASIFAAKSGFTEGEIPHMLVLLLDGIRQGKDEDELFKAYLLSKKH